MTGELNWGGFGEQGQQRLDRQQEVEKRHQARAAQLAELRTRVPAWQDGIRQVEALLVDARADVAAARAEVTTCWDVLERAAYVRQRGEAFVTNRGETVFDAQAPELARQRQAWEEAQEREQKRLRRVNSLEAERAHYRALIAEATGTT